VYFHYSKVSASKIIKLNCTKNTSFLQKKVFLFLFLFLLLGNIPVYSQIENKLNYRELDSIQRLKDLTLYKKIDTISKKKYQKYENPKKEITTFPKQNLIESLTCYDTSGRFFIRKDSTNFYPLGNCRTTDGNFLVIGIYQNFQNNITTEKGLIIKCSDNGSVLWTKLHDSINSVNYNEIDYYRIIELQNGNFLIAGKTNNNISGNDDLILIKINPIGDILWNKVYKSRLWGQGNASSNSHSIQQIKEDPFSGDIFLTASHWSEGRNITKINISNGNILWSNFYQISGNTFDSPIGIDILANEIRSFGKTFTTSTTSIISIYRINKNNGDTLQTKFFAVVDTPTLDLSFLRTEPLAKLNNGNYAIFGQCYGSFPFMYNGVIPLYQSAVLEIDNNLNFVQAKCFRNRVEAPYVISTNVYPDGKGVFSYLNYQSLDSFDRFIVQFQNNTILKERKISYLGESPGAAGGLLLRMNDGGDMEINILVNNTIISSRLEFLKLHISDTASICLGINDSATFIQSFLYTPISWGVNSIEVNDFQETTNKTLTASTTNLTTLQGCTITSFCDSIKMTSSATTLCNSQPLFLTIKRNRECGAFPLFDYDSTHVQSFTQINDSIYKVIFNSSWQGYIYASIAGCSLKKDSIFISVFSTPPPLNLGLDTNICPFNTIILNAHSGYASYHWNTGSLDSTISVTTTGIYFVDVIDGCGIHSSDTIKVFPSPSIPFDIGPDRIKCNNDTLNLHAPSGFLNYSWSPNYNINSLSNQNVIIKPLIDTSYFIRAEKTSGCFAFDTIKIKVNYSPIINLGLDKSLCAGDSIKLNAGLGFSQYLWNTGQVNQQISAHSIGTYIVTATTLQGCKSSDTLKVLNVFPLPIISLNKNPNLCNNELRILNAGSAFTDYLWSNGSNTSSINVAGIGKYWVRVKDINSCIASDTTEIKNIIPPPTLFLPTDTLICTYETIKIKALSFFTEYLWNNGSINNEISISSAGLYWLRVKDNFGCYGKDTILINPKQCNKGFYIPNAFTPNQDGYNDIYKPFIFGNIKKYEFLIFDRWGNKVFETDKISSGWNGKINGILQGNGSYVWVCKYQIDGGIYKNETGSFILLR
jgi:gliding motility-associated-like protein